MKKPPYTHGFIDRHGKSRWYLRHPRRKKIPLPGLPWSPEFMAAYEAGMKQEWATPDIGASRTVPGTININAAIVSYYNTSAEFRAYAAGTQKMRRAILEAFRVDHGDKRIALLDARALNALLAKKMPFAARNLLKTLRGLLKHAVLNGLRRDDPTRDVVLGRAPKTDGFYTWTDEDVGRYRAHHEQGTRARLALELLLGTGLARADVVRLGHQHIQAGTLAIRRQKTAAPINIPLLPELEAAISAIPKTQLTFLLTGQGKPFTPAGFGGWFRDRCDEAGLPGCAAHGLRKAAATRLAEHGATVNELMAWFGWSSAREAERYTKGADRKRLAKNAASLLIPRTLSGKPDAQFAKNPRISLKS